MLRSLVQGGKYDPEAKKMVPCDPPLHFAEQLYGVIKGELLGWATGGSSFVVVAMVESDEVSEGVRKEILASLKKGRKGLEKATKEKEIEVPAEGKKKAKKITVKGNAGAKILLEKLG